MKVLSSLLAVAGVATVLAVPPAALATGTAAGAPSCVAEQLGHSGSVSSSTGVDGRGRVIGSASDPAGNPRGVRWTDGVPEDLGDFRPGAVNRRGVMAGYLGSDAAVWREGKVTLLPRGGTDTAIAKDINERGDVVGQIFQAGMRTRAVVWPAAEPGTVRILDDSPTIAGAESIDDHGLIAGWSGLSTQTQTSVVWRIDGTVVREYPAPTTPAFTGLSFADITHGRVAATRVAGADQEVVSVDVRTGRIAPVPGGAGGWAYSSDISGAIVGSGASGPTLWSRGQATVLTPPSGLSSGVAAYLGFDGSVIAGEARDSAGNRVAVLWRCR